MNFSDYLLIKLLFLILYQMLYSTLDTGNFFVVSGSPVDVWSAESYIKSHSKYQLRKQNGFREDDLLVLVVGSSFFYNELPWDFAVAMQAARPLLNKFSGANHLEESFKFIFLCGSSTDSYREALQVLINDFVFSFIGITSEVAFCGNLNLGK